MFGSGQVGGGGAPWLVGHGCRRLQPRCGARRFGAWAFIRHAQCGGHGALRPQQRLGSFTSGPHSTTLNLLCQGAVRFGGQDWDGPHLMVGRLLLGHTVRSELLGGADRSLSGHRLAASQPDIGSDPTHILPFHSLKAKGWHAPKDGGGDPTGPGNSSTSVTPPWPVRTTSATSSLPAGYALRVIRVPDAGTRPSGLWLRHCRDSTCR